MSRRPAAPALAAYVVGAGLLPMVIPAVSLWLGSPRATR